MVVTVNGVTKTRFEHWYGSLPSFIRHLRTWGEAGIVKTRSLATPKINDRGVPCMFVGYAKNHPGDTYRMFNPTTGGILESRDVLWLRRMYYEKPLSPKEFQVQSDGVLRNDPLPHTPLHEFATIDDMEIIDTVPSTLTTPIPPDLEEEDDDVQVDNGNEDEEEAQQQQQQQQQPVTTTRSGRISKPAVRYADSTPQEHDDDARRRQLLMHHAHQDATSSSSSDSEPEEFVDAEEEAKDDDNNSNEDNNSTANSNDEELGEISLGHIDVQDFEPGELSELGLISTSLGGGFDNTAELKPMKYNEAMAGPDKAHWVEAVVDEKKRFDTSKAVEAMSRGQLPPGTKPMDSTWACKKKSNGTYRARLNLRGYKQIDGEHFDSHSVSSPVASIITVHIVLALVTILGWYSSLVDVNGAFLLGDWESDREIYMEVPQGWEHLYPPNTVLKLLKTVYGSRQGAKRFWVKALKVMDEMSFSRSKADPCLYYKWHADFGLILIISHVDDFCINGTKAGVEATKKEFFSHFECDDTGETKEYIGNKIERKDGELKMTQPVLLQSFTDEFTFTHDHKIRNPAVPGTVLHPTEGMLSKDDLFTYRSGTGKLLHLMKWSHPEIGNTVRELSCFMSGAGLSHLKAMYRVMNYCLNTADRGKVFKPTRHCKPEDIANFVFVLEGYSDSDYAKDPIKRRSVSGYCSFLEGCVINTKSRMQPIVSLSVTEAELIAATECAQDLIYAKNILESIGLKVQLPIILHIDNSGCIDLICNWSSGGRTRHMETRLFWLRELKEEEPSIILPVYCPSELNRSDIYTKNCESALFDEHVKVFCTDNVYN